MVIKKSEIYKSYNFAFKFVNRHRIGYPLYFSVDKSSLPFGKIEKDLGNYINDFYYEDQNGGDGSTARAYKVSIQVEGLSDRQIPCIALTHETGFEVFLVAAGGFIGGKVAEFALTKVLEHIEKAINRWYEKIKEKRKWLKERYKLDKPVIEHIVVRTPNWKIAFNGRFSKEERIDIIEHISRSLKPPDSIVECAAGMENKTLSKKLITSARKIRWAGGQDIFNLLT